MPWCNQNPVYAKLNSLGSHLMSKGNRNQATGKVFSLVDVVCNKLNIKLVGSKKQCKNLTIVCVDRFCTSILAFYKQKTRYQLTWSLFLNYIYHYSWTISVLINLLLLWFSLLLLLITISLILFLNFFYLIAEINSRCVRAVGEFYLKVKSKKNTANINVY